MKIRNIKILLSFFFFIVLIGLFKLQIIGFGYYNSLSEGNRIRLNPIIAARGDIYDKNGNLLAGSRLSFNLAVIPQESERNKQLLSELSLVLGTTETDLRNNLKRNTINYFVPAVVAEDISKQQAFYIEENILNYNGAVIQTAPLREYLHGESLAHVLGYDNKLSAEEYKNLRFYGYKPIDLVGRAGVERSYDSYLKGNDGGFQVEVDNRGRHLRLIGSKKPQKGRDVYLSVDLELQNFIHSLIKDKKGAICVWNPNDGKVLAMVSAPTFDPNLFINPNEEKNRKIRQILNAPSSESPMINRNIQAVYPPGSVFKVVGAVCGLEEGIINTNSEFYCPGYMNLGKRRFNCWYRSGHGNQDVVAALKNSCNVFFYEMGLKAGIDNLSDYALRFGFGVPTGVDLPFEQSGLAADRQWKLRVHNDRWYPGDTVSLSIGQGYMQVTPLQILRMASVVASGGYLVVPSLVERIEDMEVKAVKSEYVNFNAENLKLVSKGMDLAVSPQGTAKRALVPGVNIAGKTGTVQNPHGKTHAVFVCYFPVEAANFALLVFIEHGGSGGYEAAGIAQKIISFMKEEGFI